MSLDKYLQNRIGRYLIKKFKKVPWVEVKKKYYNTKANITYGMKIRDKLWMAPV